MFYVPLKKKGHTRITFLGDDIIVTFHSTNIVVFNNKRIILNSNGWLTPTTKERMNQASDEFELGFRIFQKDFTWFVKLQSGNVFDFKDGMTIYR